MVRSGQMLLATALHYFLLGSGELASLNHIEFSFSLFASVQYGIPWARKIISGIEKLDFKTIFFVKVSSFHGVLIWTSSSVVTCGFVLL